MDSKAINACPENKVSSPLFLHMNKKKRPGLNDRAKDGIGILNTTASAIRKQEIL
jgi:hypothetical protein